MFSQRMVNEIHDDKNDKVTVIIKEVANHKTEVFKEFAWLTIHV
jgi:hypothetical protein